KAHVAGEYELAAHSANPTFDLRDGNEAAGAYVPKDLADRGISVELRCRLAVLLDPSNVNMGNEIVGVRALEHDHLDRVVGLGSLNERDQIPDEFRPLKIHGRGINRCEQNSA